MFCRSLFVLLSLFFWPFYCLSFFDLLFLVILLVSSNLYCYSKICWISRIHESWHIQTKSLSYDMPTVDWTININQWLHTIHKGCIKIGRFYIVMFFYCLSGRRGHHRMVIGFITTYAISVYHHSRCEVESSPGEVYSIQYNVIKFVSDLRLFFPGTPVSSTNKTDRHNVTEILLTVASNAIYY